MRFKYKIVGFRIGTEFAANYLSNTFYKHFLTMRNNRALIVIVSLIICVTVLYTYTKAQEQPKKPLGKIDKVLVLKSERKMQLIKNGEVVRTYKIALGNNPIGHKQKEGDERTPEGNYVLDWRNEQSHYYKSMHISYPNAEDKRQAKAKNVSPGGNIMIHALPNGMGYIGTGHTANDWTDGCIAITNEQMDELWGSASNGTPIEIKP